MKYYRQLDSVRAFAVFFVIISHWAPSNGSLFDSIMFLLSGLGVNTFFVLSGFLITGILLKSRANAETFGLSKSNQLKAFYIRRALRIFPVYYLTLLFLFVFRHKLSIGNTELLYGATYSLNFYFFQVKFWSAYTAHFWTLAVEEQFYLIWPWLILFLNKQYVIHAIIFFIITGILTQYVAFPIDYGLLLTPTCFDSFGFGALLAWIVSEREDILNRFYIISSILALLAFCTFLAPLQGITLISNLPRTFQSIVGLWLITNIVKQNGKGGIIHRYILSFPPLIFLGTISYGLYVYHVIVHQLTATRLHALLDRVLPPMLNKHQPYFVFTINLVLLLVISWLSWIVLERPFLRFKQFFTYSDPRPA